MLTPLLTHGSIQRTVVLVCIALALLALPLAGTLHCEVTHNDQPASTPLADACCVFLCMSVLVSALAIQLTWVSITYTTFELKPVRLANRLTRWVPPPRPSALRP